MTRVKEFRSPGNDTIDDAINEFIEKNNIIRIIDIKYSVSISVSDACGNANIAKRHAALMIYDD